MKNSKYVIKIYDKTIIEHEFNSIELPKHIYFSGHFYPFPTITKIELWERRNGKLEKIMVKEMKKNGNT